MKNLLPFVIAVLLIACNSDKKEKAGTSSGTETSTNTPASTKSSADATVSFSISDSAKTLPGSVLVQKDKSNVSPGNDRIAIVTANGPNGESFVVNFAFSLKPGTYPVVGVAYTAGAHVFGGILGGEPKMTTYKVNLVQVDDLGKNGYGGNKWRISGTVDEEVTINAMGIMKMDKTHPESIKVNKIVFRNLDFDDNMDQLMEDAMKK